MVNCAEIQVKSVHLASFKNQLKRTLFTRFMTQLTIYALVSCLSAYVFPLVTSHNFILLTCISVRNITEHNLPISIFNNTQIGPNNHRTCTTIHLLYSKSLLVIINCVNLTLFWVIFVLDSWTKFTQNID